MKFIGTVEARTRILTVDGGLTHLQYTDDTILFLDFDENSVMIVMFLLLCFEPIYGLKINFQKSEILVSRVNRKDKIRIAKLFNCDIGEFPMNIWVYSLPLGSVGF